jgi:hypothetical protein
MTQVPLSNNIFSSSFFSFLFRPDTILIIFFFNFASTNLQFTKPVQKQLLDPYHGIHTMVSIPWYPYHGIHTYHSKANVNKVVYLVGTDLKKRLLFRLSLINRNPKQTNDLLKATKRACIIGSQHRVMLGQRYCACAEEY